VEIMAVKLEEHTYGTHIYMKMRLDNKRIEEIDVYLRNDGNYYVTSVDHGMELYKGEELEKRKRLRQEIIDTFKKLY
jgi:hypothetical protein